MESEIIEEMLVVTLRKPVGAHFDGMVWHSNYLGEHFDGIKEHLLTIIHQHL